MTEKITFPKDVVVGKYYRVPHVYCKDFYSCKGYMPINTPLHEDKEYINFEHLHFHCDWRFLSNRFYNSICGNDLYNCKLRSEVSKVILIKLTNGQICTDGVVFYKTVKAKRQYQNNRLFDFHTKLFMSSTWPGKLQDAFCGEHLRINNNGQYICPHKGAVIDLSHVDENGYAVCPAHLLRFNVETLKAIDLK